MDSPIPSQELNIALKAIKAGAKKALTYYDQNIAFELKDDNTIITVADKETEYVIKDVIHESLPNAKFVAEESGGDSDVDEFWVIDPIDGTRSFSRGVPTWNILLAHCKNNEITLGVSYFPVLDILIYAEQGKGAYLNGQKVNVSSVDSVAKSFLGTGSPRHFKDKQVLIDLMNASGSLRMLELNFTNMLIAKGGFDGMVDAYGMTWDLAPYKVIIEEAGGRITRLDGSEWKIDGQRGGILSNGIIHDELVKIVAGRN